jgi:metallophosphoesterase superfamily enzyme
MHHDWLLTAARAAIHVPTATAVVADLHLGYGEARRRGGDAVPAPAIAPLLEPLRKVFQAHAVQRLVIAGDLFEAGHSAELERDLLDWLQSASVEMTAVVPGNHDRGLARASTVLPIYPDGFSVAAWRVVHGDGALPPGPVVQGHEHPWFRRSEELSAPCYLLSADRLILPAYSADAAGVNVLRRRKWCDCRCAVIVGDEVLDFGWAADLRARLRRRT